MLSTLSTRDSAISKPLLMCGISVVCILCSCPLSSIATEIYTWVDAKGVTHYSQQAPKDHELKTTTLSNRAIEPAKIGYVAPPKPIPTTTPQTELETSAALVKQQNAKQAQAICDSAKQNLAVLTTHTRLIRQTDDGKEPVAMTEEERQASIVEQQQRISLFCDKS